MIETNVIISNETFTHKNLEINKGIMGKIDWYTFTHGGWHSDDGQRILGFITQYCPNPQDDEKWNAKDDKDDPCTFSMCFEISKINDNELNMKIKGIRFDFEKENWEFYELSNKLERI